jgi:hypothetical protein
MAPPAGACAGVPPQQVRVGATARGQVMAAATVVEADEMGLPCDSLAGLTLVAGAMASEPAGDHRANAFRFKCRCYQSYLTQSLLA